VATISSDKGSGISPNASASGILEYGRLMEWIAWMVSVSHFSLLIGFPFSYNGYCLNVLVWLWKLVRGQGGTLSPHTFRPGHPELIIR